MAEICSYCDEEINEDEEYVIVVKMKRAPKFLHDVCNWDDIISCWAEELQDDE